MTAKRFLQICGMLILSALICGVAIFGRWLEVYGPEWLLVGERPARLCDQGMFVGVFIICVLALVLFGVVMTFCEDFIHGR